VVFLPQLLPITGTMAVGMFAAASSHLSMRSARFCGRFGDDSGRHALSRKQQLALNPKILRFVAWAIATHRVRPTAAYLIARRAHQGNLLARIHLLMHADFVATAVEWSGLNSTAGIPTLTASARWASIRRPSGSQRRIDLASHPAGARSGRML
jgi:hypothetical protein